ncbi:alpha-L-fucosidase 2 [Pedobacter africanus]
MVYASKKLLSVVFFSFFMTIYALAQQPGYQLFYTKPAIKWTDALPIGNGRLGAMVFGGIEKDRIQFNEETLWTGGPRDYNHKGAAAYLPQIRQLLFEGKQQEAEKLAAEKFMGTTSKPLDPQVAPEFQASYQPFGDLYLDFKTDATAASNYKRKLDLNTAVASTAYSLNGVNYLREYFVSQPNQAVVIRLTADKKANISLDAALSSPHKYHMLKKINENTLALSLRVSGGVLKGESQLRAVITGGKLLMGQGKISITAADAVTFYLTAGTNFVNDKDVTGLPANACIKTLTGLTTKTYAQVKAAHVKEYQKYYQAFSVSFGNDVYAAMPTDERIEKFAGSDDAGLAALYMQYGRYLLISSSRPGTQPANLQGIWNELLTPPWGSKYTTNINLEMNYWPTGVLNLGAMNQPLFKKINALAKNGTQTARIHYNANGWVLHHNTDLWNGTAPINASDHGIWVTGAGWLSQHLWEHYLFTQDFNFLRNEAYPIMKQAAVFFSDFLVKDPKTGWLISTPSNSPENGGLVAGPTMDHQIIRTLFKNCIAATELLGTDTAFRKNLQQKITLIAPNQIGKYNQLQEWLEDKDDTTSKHRHVSHLWGVHPGNDITWDTPDLMRAARQSLIYRGDEGTGWSLAWKINFWSRFKDGEHAMKMLKMLISPAEKGGGAYLNLFDAHPPFQIDGNFGGAAGIAEMLLQSHTQFVELLPALPAGLPEGEVRGMGARGGFLLNFKWSKGVLTEFEVYSKGDGVCLLRYGNKITSIATQKGMTYKFNGDLEKL